MAWFFRGFNDQESVGATCRDCEKFRSDKGFIRALSGQHSTSTLSLVIALSHNGVILGAYECFLLVFCSQYDKGFLDTKKCFLRGIVRASQCRSVHFLDELSVLHSILLRRNILRITCLLIVTFSATWLFLKECTVNWWYYIPFLENFVLVHVWVNIWIYCSKHLFVVALYIC